MAEEEDGGGGRDDRGTPIPPPPPDADSELKYGQKYLRAAKVPSFQ